MASSPWKIARSAIRAGQLSRGVRVNRKEVNREMLHEKVLSDNKKGESISALDWATLWGGKGGRLWQDQDLSAGTPYVCLYTLGRTIGKHPLGLTIVVVVGVAAWAVFMLDSVANDHENIGEMWTNLALYVVTSASFFYRELRTPNDDSYTVAIWVALALETLMVNTLTCMAYVFLIWSDEWWTVLGEETWLVRRPVSLFPCGLWAFVRQLALYQQAATLRTQNMSKGRGLHITASRKGFCTDTICACIRAIIEESRSLRPTGLSKEELKELAKLIPDTREAHHIGSFIHEHGKESSCDLLEAFHIGYTDVLTRKAEPRRKLLTWSKKWMDHAYSADPLGALTKLAESTVDDHECSAYLKEASTVSGEERQIWWLCGAIASFKDSDTEEGDPEECRSASSSSFQWYALLAAGLSVNRNAMATILAMTLDGKASTTVMKEKMQKGCEEVLHRVSDNAYVLEGRGLVVTTALTENVPVNGASEAIPNVIYSPAAVWEAERSREAVMLGRDGFNELFRLVLAGERLEDGAQLLEESALWPKKVNVWVDSLPVFISLRLATTELTDVRATAYEGWITHCTWTVLVISVHLSAPHHLPILVCFSIICPIIDPGNQYAYVVYVGFVLWRTWIGRICQIIPAMSDDDTNNMAWYLFVIAVLIVNVGGGYLGNAPKCKAAGWIFWFLMLSSCLAGFYALVLYAGPGCKGNTAFFRYQGRSRGVGYGHRKARVAFRPVGRDLLCPDAIQQTAT